MVVHDEADAFEMVYANPNPQLTEQLYSALEKAGGVERPAVELNSGIEASGTEAEVSPEIDLRQLRHHTKNTLQRMLALISEVPGLHDTPENQRLARELQRRIHLSATISNTLFGFTDAPGSMAERLRNLAGAMVDMMGSADQMIRVGVLVRGTCPDVLRQTVIRTAHELIGNAVKHGMKGRPSGRIAVRLVSQDVSTTLAIVDNGWGFSGRPREGEGLTLARSLAAKHGGALRLEGVDGGAATLELPHWR
jgi:two-component sensor histidine kinase